MGYTKRYRPITFVLIVFRIRPRDRSSGDCGEWQRVSSGCDERVRDGRTVTGHSLLSVRAFRLPQHPLGLRCDPWGCLDRVLGWALVSAAESVSASGS